MSALTNFWNSERGLLAAALIIGSVVLAALSVITPEQWLDYSKWIFSFYVGGKTVTGAIEAYMRPRDAHSPQSTPPAGGAS